MDIYSYLNSPDVAAHCRKLNHSFNALESAFIINNCMHLNIHEKHQLFREIMETMQDVQIKKFRDEKAGIGDIYTMRKVIEKHELKEEGDE